MQCITLNIYYHPLFIQMFFLPSLSLSLPTCTYFSYFFKSGDFKDFWTKNVFFSEYVLFYSWKQNYLSKHDQLDLGKSKASLKFSFLWYAKNILTTNNSAHVSLHTLCRKFFPSDRRWENSQLMRHWVVEYVQILARNSEQLWMCQKYIFKTSMPPQYALLQVIWWDLIKCGNTCKSGLYSTMARDYC